MARFKGTTKTEFLDNRQLHGHAFHILDEAMHFILRNIPIAGRIEAGKLERQDTPLYPPLALREALVNALCHRDYAIAGGAVNVASIRAHPSASERILFWSWQHRAGNLGSPRPGTVA